MPFHQRLSLGLLTLGIVCSASPGGAAPAPAGGVLFKFERRGDQCVWLRISPPSGQETPLALLPGSPEWASWFPHRSLPKALVWTERGLWEVQLNEHSQRALGLPLQEKIARAQYDAQGRPWVQTKSLRPFVFEGGRWKAARPGAPIDLSIWPRANDIVETSPVSGPALQAQLAAIRGETQSPRGTTSWVQLASRQLGPIYARCLYTDDETAEATLLPLVLPIGGHPVEVQDLGLDEASPVGLTCQGSFILLTQKTATRLVDGQSGRVLYRSDKGEPAQFWPIWRGLNT